jgi:MFS transporter, SP family, sugar:H+ symporter
MGHAVPITDANPTGHTLSSSQRSLVVSILSAGTFFGALIGGQAAEWIGRRITIMVSCLIFAIGVAVQVAATTVKELVGGRLVAGLGVGGVSAVVILYVSEISPKRVRGLLVSVYQWAITIGLLIAACVDQGTQNLNNRNSYRIPIALQLIWAAILAFGLSLLPESPRYLIKKGKPDAALKALSRVRGQPADSPYLLAELAEIQANYDYEMRITSTSWLDCFKGGLRSSSNLRRVLIGTSLQMFQQWTGVNFICKSILSPPQRFIHRLTLSNPIVYYGTTFFQQSGIKNAFLITIITNIVNVCSTPLSFYTIERFGRRTLLIYGALLMLISEFIIAIVGTAAPRSEAASKVLIAFVCVYIFGFASTWGPAAWVIIGELFPLPIRAKGVALSTASNWFWNCIIGVVTPYMVDQDQGDLGPKVFFVWGSTCCLCLLFAYFCVPETKGLSLEQVDRMLEETTPRNSRRWVPHSTYAKEAERAGRKEEGAAVSEGENDANGGVGAEHDEKLNRDKGDANFGNHHV